MTYYIKVYGYSSNSTFSLNVTCSSPAPANDACANAINVNAYPYTSAVISNANATDDVPTSTLLRTLQEHMVAGERCVRPDVRKDLTPA
ncbi:MAG: hypothetical protein IPI00_12750 [Flavobacteriales bacterium]|nr:hypothetical protein [Flavobacteriales bacterium]